MNSKEIKYTQKIYNIDYSKNPIDISLTRNEWNAVGTWVNSVMSAGTERLSKEWFEDLYWLVMQPISNEINFSGKTFPWDEDIKFQIPRQLLRMFVFSVGGIAYNFDVKTPTSMGAQMILSKINEQLKQVLPADDKWWNSNF